MRIQFTSECLQCGKHHDDGGMTALTAERDASHENVHHIVTYGQCCRDEAMRDAGIRFDANHNVREECAAAWQAFLASETIETIRS